MISLDIFQSCRPDAQMPYFGNAPHGKPIVGKHACGYTNGYAIGVYDGKPHFAFYGNSFTESPTAKNDGIWHYYTGIYDGSNISLYIDGNLAASNPATTPVQNSLEIHIGASSAACGYFNGSIDDIRIYNRALSASEIQQLYQGANTGTCSSDIVTFAAGTPAKAADVNSNFVSHTCQIQALKAIVCQDHPTANICQ